MKKLLSTSQIVSNFEISGRAFEICATADASFDETPSSLLIELDSFVRPVTPQPKGDHLDAGWLPKNQTLTEHVAATEASDLARDIFHRWVQTIRESIPPTLNRSGVSHAVSAHHTS